MNFLGYVVPVEIKKSKHYDVKKILDMNNNNVNVNTRMWQVHIQLMNTK